jgi:glycosyltransferase involved in cell wall biosynthesis
MLQARARELQLASVRFHDSVPREEVAALYRSADVCLVPLRALRLFRSFIPSKMFEILACGRPVLASLEGEAAEILRESGAALIVPPEDADAMSAALLRLAGDPALRSQLASRGRAFVAERFDRRRLAVGYVEILQTIARSAC